jgi:hypothetical protein
MRPWLGLAEISIPGSECQHSNLSAGCIYGLGIGSSCENYTSPGGGSSAILRSLEMRYAIAANTC